MQRLRLRKKFSLEVKIYLIVGCNRTFDIDNQFFFVYLYVLYYCIVYSIVYCILCKKNLPWTLEPVLKHLPHQCWWYIKVKPCKKWDINSIKTISRTEFNRHVPWTDNNGNKQMKWMKIRMILTITRVTFWITTLTICQLVTIHNDPKKDSGFSEGVLYKAFWKNSPSWCCSCINLTEGLCANTSVVMSTTLKQVVAELIAVI